MKTLVLKIEYDGTNYAGWQVQPNAPTVQEELGKALYAASGQKLSVIGAGRTDAGVHGRGQVAHSLLPDDFRLPTAKITDAINYYLPDDIKILDSAVTPEPFHAVRDAVRREYSYRIHLSPHPTARLYSAFIKYKIDYSLLCNTAELFTGEHDFTTFSKDNPETRSYICKLEQCSWEKETDDRYRLTIASNRFVYGMVRSLVGAMLDAARGKRTVEEISDSLQKADRRFCSPLAPACGLTLEKVSYPPEKTFV